MACHKIFTAVIILIVAATVVRARESSEIMLNLSGKNETLSICCLIIGGASIPLILHLLWDFAELKCCVRSRKHFLLMARFSLLFILLASTIVCSLNIHNTHFSGPKLVSLMTSLIVNSTGCISTIIVLNLQETTWQCCSGQTTFFSRAFHASLLAVFAMIAFIFRVYAYILCPSVGVAILYANSIQFAVHIQSCIAFAMWRQHLNLCNAKENIADESDEVAAEFFLGIFALRNVVSSIVTFASGGFLNFQILLESSWLCTELYIDLAFVAIALVFSSRYPSMKVIQGLRRLVEDKISFIRYISHEIRTPLNIILLSLGFIESEAKALVDIVDVVDVVKVAPLIEATIDMTESCQSAVCVLDDLLTIDKMQSNKYLIELEDVKIVDYLKQTRRQFSVLAQQNEISIGFQFDNDESNVDPKCCVRMDKNKISQVLRNLLSNSIKFTPKHGNVQILLKMCTVDPATRSYYSASSSKHGVFNNRSSSSRKSLPTNVVAPEPADSEHSVVAVITVRDTGVGLSADNQKLLFNEYVQFNANVLQKGKGSGLGLWISKSE